MKSAFRELYGRVTGSRKQVEKNLDSTGHKLSGFVMAPLRQEAPAPHNLPADMKIADKSKTFPEVCRQPIQI
jgi:hypothetical protein